MPVDTAMKEYISIVDGLEPGVKAPLEKKVGIKATMGQVAHQPGAIRKKGILYKQRDLFKGWRPRYFVLQDCVLHYYLDADEPVPRNTLDLTGCNVVSQKAVSVDGIEYFPFTISHPHSKITYNLSCDSKLEADIWVSKILEASATSGSFSAQNVSESADIPPDLQLTSSEAYSVTKRTEHSQETRAFLPSDLAPKLERQAQTVIDSLDVNSPGWDVLMDKNGLLAKKKPSANTIHIKAEIDVPYCLYDVFALLSDKRRQLEVDPSREVNDRLQDISMHSWVDYIQAKGIWPSSPREFIVFFNWRLLSTGQVLIVAFSDARYEELRAVENGHVRGETLVSGFLLSPLASGTKLQYLLQTNPNGSIPSAVLSFASSGQAMLLANIKKVSQLRRL
jgi:hypothetical protein